MRFTSGYPQFNGSHLGLPPVFAHRMTGLGGGKFVWSMIWRMCAGLIRSSWRMCAGPIRSSSDACACCLPCQVILFSCGFFFSTFSVMEKLVARAPHLINKGKDDGFTPLHLAAFNNHVGVATVLLQQVGCLYHSWDNHLCMHRHELSWAPSLFPLSSSKKKIIHRRAYIIHWQGVRKPRFSGYTEEGDLSVVCPIPDRALELWSLCIATQGSELVHSNTRVGSKCFHYSRVHAFQPSSDELGFFIVFSCQAELCAVIVTSLVLISHLLLQTGVVPKGPDDEWPQNAAHAGCSSWLFQLHWAVSQLWRRSRQARRRRGHHSSLGRHAILCRWNRRGSAIWCRAQLPDSGHGKSMVQNCFKHSTVHEFMAVHSW